MPLPPDLARISRGYAALTPRARRLGAEAAEAARRALAQVLGAELTLRARAVAGEAWERGPAARLALDLAGVPALASLEIEPALVVRLVDRLAGGEGAAPGAAALTPLERAALELLALLALDGICGVAEVEQLLRPRLARAAPPPREGALGIELTLAAGAAVGRARLLLPAAALRALAGEPEPAESPLRLPASLRRGAAALLPAELEALGPGDVVLLDAGGSGGCTGPDAAGTATVAALVLPGGFRATGRLGPDGLHVEEVSMPARTLQIPIALEVELCRVELPLSELARLAPGAVLPLPVDLRGQVTLRAGERAVARGELVEVDGAAGVRIDTLEVEP